MKLFFIACNTDPEMNEDLLVRCETVDEAIAHWREAFHPDREDDPVPERIFEVPDQGVGVLRWFDDVKQVWGSNSSSVQ